MFKTTVSIFCITTAFSCTQPAASPQASPDTTASTSTSNNSSWSTDQVLGSKDKCTSAAILTNPDINIATAITACTCLIEDAAKRWSFDDYAKNEPEYTQTQKDEGTYSKCLASNKSADNQFALTGTYESPCISLSSTTGVIQRITFNIEGTEMTRESFSFLGSSPSYCDTLLEKITQKLKITRVGTENNDYLLDLQRISATRKVTDFLGTLNPSFGYSTVPFWTDVDILGKQSSAGSSVPYPRDEFIYHRVRKLGSTLYLGAINSTDATGSTPDKRPKEVDNSVPNNAFAVDEKIYASDQLNISGDINSRQNIYPQIKFPKGDDITVSCENSCPPEVTVSNNIISFLSSIGQTKDIKFAVHEVSNPTNKASFRVVINSNKAFFAFADADGDGVGAGTIGWIKSPHETLPSGYSTTNTDCDDNNGSMWQYLTYTFRDADGDGYTVPSSGVVCSSASLPSGFTNAANGNDCDDTDLSNWDRKCWSWVTGSSASNALGVYGTKGVAAAANTPGGRSRAATWRDASGNLWLFGGLREGAGDYLNDLWKFDGTNWTWVTGSSASNALGVYGTKGVATASNTPGSRTGAVSWRDSSGNFWLFGGSGFAATGAIGRLNDLWKFDGTNWTWVSGSSVTNALGVYGTKGVASASNIPGSRSSAASWQDSSGNLWLFGGSGFAATATSGPLNDLWKFDGSNWTWVSGSSVTYDVGIYGTKGVAASANIPGGREGAVSWRDTSGNLLLFGGSGFAATGAIGRLNDLWKFDGTNWTWISGSSVINALGVYGTIGVAAASNTPGGCNDAISWQDSSGNLWLFGGLGYAPTGAGGFFNVLWKFDGTNWTWVSGSYFSNALGVYGAQGVADAANSPGGRYKAASWQDSSGNLWLFGGYGFGASGADGRLNDLWKFTP